MDPVLGGFASACSSSFLPACLHCLVLPLLQEYLQGHHWQDAAELAYNLQLHAIACTNKITLLNLHIKVDSKQAAIPLLCCMHL